MQIKSNKPCPAVTVPYLHNFDIQLQYSLFGNDFQAFFDVMKQIHFFRIDRGGIILYNLIVRGVAQLVACLTGGQEAASSSLVTPTIEKANKLLCLLAFYDMRYVCNKVA